jgi:hypothetical protein
LAQKTGGTNAIAPASFASQARQFWSAVHAMQRVRAS